MPNTGSNNVKDVRGILEALFPEGEIKGEEYRHLCAFHDDEHLGNCSTNLLSGRGFCFACGESWNLVLLVAKKKGLAYGEAVRQLAGRDPPGGPINAGDPLQTALARYLENYRTSADARGYAAGRGLLPQTIKEFEIGYALDSWSDLTDRIRGKPRERAIEINLLGRSKGRVYDAFRNRLTFPVRDRDGTLAGIAGRELDSRNPKYLNTSFEKGKVLYGLHKTGPLIAQAGKGVLVEGYLDLLICLQNGVENVCAVAGTALTGDHALLMKELVDDWIVCFDGDEAGRKAGKRASELLADAEIQVRMAELPEGEDPASLPREALLERLENAPELSVPSKAPGRKAKGKKTKPLPIQPDGTIVFSNTGNYGESNGCLYSAGVDGESGNLYLARRLSNWTARILEELTVDNGLDTTHVYRIEASMKNRTTTVSVRSSEFLTPSSWIWYAEALGPTATVNPDVRAVEKHIRTAIQEFSEPQVLKRYACTGWVRENGRWKYLCPGLSEEVDLELAGLKLPYHLPRDPDPGAVEMISLFLEMANPEVTSVLLASVFLAPLVSFFSNPSVGFSVYLHGPSGTKKTSLALIILCFYGDFTGQQKLLSFEDTSNSLEAHLHSLKDILALVDDLRPGANLLDEKRLEKTAKNIIHAVGNRSGRNRMNPDATLKRQRYPRGFVIMTGERLPSGASTIARLFPVEITEVALDRLTLLQNSVHRLKDVGALYIRWLERRIETLLPDLRDVFSAYRVQLRGTLEHDRWAENAAFLKVGLLAAAQFLEDMGVTDSGRLLDLSMHFESQATGNGTMLRDERPAERFLRATRDLVNTGKVFIKGLGGADSLGSVGRTLIGYVDLNYLYLYPGSAYHECCIYYRDEQGAPLPPSSALMQDLASQGYVVARHKAKKIEGRSLRLLWLNPAVLQEEDCPGDDL
jgi:hypothetical protein